MTQSQNLTPPSTTATTADAPRWSSVPLMELVGQLTLMLLAALLYFGVRALTEGDQTVAVAHGRDILNLERTLGIDLERGIQSLIVNRHWLVTLMNWMYIFGHWPVITAVFIWLFHTRRLEYLRLRNAMFISGAIGLVIFTMYPVAPPRLAGVGLEDTVTMFSTSYRVLQPPRLADKYAAMPSLHLGWNLLVGMAIARNARRRPVRLLGAISPLLMALAVISTANHYVLDTIVGSIVACSPGLRSRGGSRHG